MLHFLWIGIGGTLLYLGGEALVAGARGLALRLGVRPLVIGLTVVALGTSMPELAATLAAALQGSPEMALGNVVGSNIANLGLVLGVAALIAPLVVEGRFLAREVPFMLASSVLMMLFAWDGALGRIEGAMLVAGLVVFLTLLLGSRPETLAVTEEFSQEFSKRPSTSLRVELGKVGLGIVALTLGAEALVTGAVGLARAAGIEERIIGLTLVAFGTSLPELASTIVAARRREEGDIILGNLIGSNVFNILFVLGTSVLVRPLSIPSRAVEVDLAVMLGFGLLVWRLLLSRRRLDRWEGALLVAFYGTYVAWLFARG